MRATFLANARPAKGRAERHVPSVGVAATALAGLFWVGIAASASAADRLQLEVVDANTGQTLQTIQPKDVLPIAVGQQVRLRMTAVPSNGAQVRGLRTQFAPNPGQSYVRVVENDTARGTLAVTGLRPHGVDGAVPIQYTVLDAAAIDPKLRSARFYIKVVGDAQVAQSPGSIPATPTSRGVTLFSDDGFGGRSQTFAADDASLADNPIGNDSVSSVRVDAGCRVTLYEHENFRGDVTVLDGDTSNLGRTDVGNDSASSLRVHCGGVNVGSTSAALTLYSDPNYRGEAVALSSDDVELADDAIGADRASSARIAPGCQAWLFEHPNFSGRSFYLTGDVADLAGTAVGADTVSSVRLRCS